MSKLITFFLVMLIGMSILAAVMAGGGGIVSTVLADNITADATTLSVDSTRDFLSQDYIVVGEERILYSGKTAVSFTGCTRGYDGTEAESHSDGDNVYTADASSVNNAMGFNIAAVSDSMGWWGTITIPFRFLFTTIPNVVRIVLSLFSGSLGIISWIWFAMCAGLIITIALSLAGGRRV